MATQIIKTTFQLKRGTAERFATINPVLAQGEPGFEYDKNRLKVGDGFTPWNDLPYIQGISGVENAETIDDFPAVGNENLVYKASAEKKLYQWNSTTQSYEVLTSASESGEIPEATDIEAGITKVYTTTGSNSDGTMTQSAITEELNNINDELDDKVEVNIEGETLYFTLDN